MGGPHGMATIDGTNGNDTIRTAAAGGSLGGLPNATDTGDTINGLAGNDVIIAGAGNDVIDGGLGNDSLYGGDGADTITAGPANNGNSDNLHGETGDDTLIALATGGNFVSLFGGPGNDTLQGIGNTSHWADYADRALAITADLGAGVVQVAGGETDTLVNITGVRGGAGNDTLLGSTRSESFTPGLGNNTIVGGGGSGTDTLQYYDLLVGVSVDLAAGTATHLADGSIDSITGIENLSGTNYTDTLVGNDQDNTFRPVAGADIIDGRGGYDTIRYSANFSGSTDIFSAVGTFNLTAGATVNLDTGTATDNWGDTDTFTSIEAAHGSNFADDLTGTELASGDRSQLRGLGGNDILRATALDTNITADYREDTATVRVNLSTADAVLGGVVVGGGTARDGFGGTDTLVMIQSIRGSNVNDVILGSDRNDRLEGEGGDDTIDGGAGNDSVRGNAGNDALQGGAGDDALRGGAGIDTYADSAGYDSIGFNDGGAAQGVVASLTTGLITDQFGNAESIGASNDFEYLIGSELADDLEGKALAGNIIQLTGGAGNDTLRAGSGGAEVVAAYQLAPGRIVADLTLASGQVSDGYGNTDTLLGVASIRGSGFDDLITGNDQGNWFRGEAGNDTIDAAGGFDVLNYANSSTTPISGIIATLNNGAGTVRDGLGGTDTVTGFERIDGSRLADTITITGTQGMHLFGNAGDDVITGGDGDDYIDGGLGLDTANGGAGHDTILVSDGTLSEVYSGGSGQDRFLIGTTLAGDYESVVADIVADFEAGAAGDIVDLTNVIDILVFTGEITAADNPFATGNLRIAAGSAILQVDWDGADGPQAFADLLILQGTTPAQLVAANFGGFDPLVASPNTPPVANPDDVSGPEDTVISGDVLANDTDADGNALTAVLVAGAAYGQVALNPDGSFTYTPDPDFNGSDSFTYRANDGTADSTIATVSLTVDAVNDAPATLALSNASIAEDAANGTVVGSFSATDVDGDALTYSLVGSAPFSVVGNQLRVAGPLDFETTPSYQLTARATDASGAFVEATFLMSVTDVDEGGGGSAPAYSFSQGFPGAPPASQAPPPASAAEVAAFVQGGSATLDGTTYSVIENIGPWNAIKNVLLGSFDTAFSTAYAIANFVSVDADFSAAGATGLDLLVFGAKRSAITTADGTDSITLLLHSNGWGGNANLVQSGGGNDTVLVTGVGNSTLDDALLADNPSPRNGPLWNQTFTGGFDTAVTVEAGAGDDMVTVAGSIAARIFGGAGQDALTGGAGRDLLDGGADADVLTGGAGRDTFLLRAGEAAGDLITDFAGDVLRLVGFGSGDSLSSLGGGQFQVGAETFTVAGATTLVAGVDYVFA